MRATLIVIATFLVSVCLFDTYQGATNEAPVLQGYLAPLFHLLAFGFVATTVWLCGYCDGRKA